MQQRQADFGNGGAHLPASSSGGDLQADTPPNTPPNKNAAGGALAGLMAGGAAMFNGYNGLHNGYAGVGAVAHHQDASKLFQGLNSQAVNSAGSFKMM